MQLPNVLHSAAKIVLMVNLELHAGRLDSGSAARSELTHAGRVAFQRSCFGLWERDLVEACFFSPCGDHSNDKVALNERLPPAELSLRNSPLTFADLRSRSKVSRGCSGFHLPDCSTKQNGHG